MNGEINSYNLSRPMSWAAFKDMPNDMQKEYVKHLVSEYQVGPTALGQMFGVGTATCSKYIKSLHCVELPKYSSNIQRKRFLDAFCDELDECEDALPPPTSPEIVASHPVPPLQYSGMALEKTTLSFSGPFSAQVIADKLAALFDSGVKVRINVDIEAIE